MMIKKITGKETDEILDLLIELAQDAGRRIMDVYNRGFNISHKEDKSPLTEADMAAHNAIEAGLSIITPDMPVLSEESTAVPYNERASWQSYWLVDPLDGTREFIKRNGEFTVNIALIDQGQPIIGVIVVPVSGLVYFACKGKGAFKSGSGDSVVPIHVRVVDPDNIVIAGSRSHANIQFKRFLEKLGKHSVISMGSSLKSCLVAEGKADIYTRFGPTSEWDTAAAQCIVEEAGGRLTDLGNRPLRYNSKDSLLNPSFVVIGDSDFDWFSLMPDE